MTKIQNEVDGIPTFHKTVQRLPLVSRVVYLNEFNCILLCLLNIISFQCLYNDNPLSFDIDNYDFLVGN